MKEALLYGVGDLRIVESPKPEIGPNEILIEVKCCALCPTDVRKYRTGDHGVPNWPFNMGHEWSGDIVEVGANVKGYTVGTRVAGAGYGSYAEFVKMDPNQIVGGRRQADRLIPLPDHVSYEAATFMEPFADCIHSIEQSQVRLGETVAILGAGQMGIQHAMVANAMGVKVISVDLLPDRLALAKKFGADYTVNGAEVDSVAEVKKLTGGQGAEGVVVTVGSPQAVVQALEMVKRAGSVVLFSGFKNGSIVSFDPNIIHYGELILTGSSGLGIKYRDVGLFRKAIELIGMGRAPVVDLVSHRFPLEELEKAIEVIGSYQGMKAIIYMP